MVDTELIMAGALSRGLNLRDFELMSLGQVVDYCITYNEINKPQEEDHVKIATQEDFDLF